MMLDLNTIHLGDCQELMRSIPDGSVDMILQDPPYNTTACKWEWDIMTVIDELWAQWKRIIKPNGAIVMTASQPFTSKLVMSNLKMFKYEWVWNKVHAVGFQVAKYRPMQQHENVLVFGNGKVLYNPIMTDRPKKRKSKLYGNSDVSPLKHIHFRDREYTQLYPKSIQTFTGADHSNILHPNQKPVALFEYLIRTYTNEGDTVFDGFSGSGTTAVACRNLNRNFICIEKDRDYWQASIDRLAKCEPQLCFDLTTNGA